MTFHKTILASVSLVVFLTGSLSAQAMSSAAASEEAASASRSAHSAAPSGQASHHEVMSSHSGSPHGSAASEPDSEAHSSHPSVNPDFEVPLATLRHTRITPALFLEPGRTPLLKEKRFVPWNPNWGLLSEKNHKHLAIDSLGRLVNEANPIHRFMARKSLEIYYSLVPNLRASRMSFREEAPACYSFDHLRAYLKGQFKAGNIWIARRFSESFQLAWNQKVDAAEAVAARNLQAKEAAHLQDLELRRELRDLLVLEFQDPSLYPRSVEERQRFLASIDDWALDITTRELMGRVLLERGRSCFAHCLRHPVLGPRLLEVVLQGWSPYDFTMLTMIGITCDYRRIEYYLEPVFPENVLPISAESQAEAARLFRHAGTPSAILAVRNSAHGPALMSLISLERVYDDNSGLGLAKLARCFPNMTDFTWIFGSDRRLTGGAVYEDIVPFIQEAPETLQRLTVKYEGVSGIREDQKAWVAQVNSGRTHPLAIEWIEESVPVQPPQDGAYLRQLLKQEMHRLFLDERRGTFTFLPWVWERGVQRELTTEATFGSFDIHKFIRNFEWGGSGLFYAALQALVQDRSDEELGAVNLSSLQDVLNTNIWRVFQARQAIQDNPYRVDFDSQGNPLSLVYYPTIPLRITPAHDLFLGDNHYVRAPTSIDFDGGEVARVPDFSYLSPRLQELLRQVQEEALPLPAPESFMIGGPEKNLLEPFGLYRTAERR